MVDPLPFIGGLTTPPLDPLMGQWQVYILLCRDNTLYTGITCDLHQRLVAHNSVKGGARYTRGRRPVTLVYSEPAASRSAAAQREWRIKGMTTAQKKALITSAAQGVPVVGGILLPAGEQG
jgi:putative endonuclease